MEAFILEGWGGRDTKEGTPLINTCDFTSRGLLLQRGVKTPPAAPPRLLDLRQNTHRFQLWQRPAEVATSGRKASRARREVGCEGKNKTSGKLSKEKVPYLEGSLSTAPTGLPEVSRSQVLFGVVSRSF